MLVRRGDRADALAVRRATRPAHLEWAAAASVVFAGPLLAPYECTGNDPRPAGSLLVLEGTPDAVRHALDNDPYKAAGLFESVEAREWICGLRSDVVALPGESVFCVWCVDKEGSKDLRAAKRPAHLDWWRDSRRTGMIGPFPAPDGNGAVGTMIVCNGVDIKEVVAWAETDPYYVAGLFDAVYVDEMSVTISKSSHA